MRNQFAGSSWNMSCTQSNANTTLLWEGTQHCTSGALSMPLWPVQVASFCSCIKKYSKRMVAEVAMIVIQRFSINANGLQIHSPARRALTRSGWMKASFASGQDPKKVVKSRSSFSNSSSARLASLPPFSTVPVPISNSKGVSMSMPGNSSSCCRPGQSSHGWTGRNSFVLCQYTYHQPW